MFFNLNNDCRFVKGSRKGMIYNFTTCEIIDLSPEESEAMLHAMTNEVSSNEILFKELVQAGYGFFSKNRFFIDRVRPFNKISLTRPDLRPPKFTVAFLQLTGNCKGDDSKCHKMFCTPCRINRACECLTVEEWKKIVDYLAEAGVGGIMLTGGDVTLYEGLLELSDYIKRKGIFYSIILNVYCRHTERVDKHESVQIYSCNSTDAFGICEKFATFKGATLIHNVDFDEGQKKMLREHSFQLVYSPSEIKISKESLFPCSLEPFFTKEYFNSCLLGKMFINAKGNVIPCLQKSNRYIGNVLEQSFSEVYQKLIMEYWYKPDKHPKCSVCERYYGCPVCSFMNPEDICQYDPENSR